MEPNKTKGDSPGCLTHVVLYAVAVVPMYFASTPEVTGNFHVGQQRDFHIAAVTQTKDANDATVVPLSLAYLKTGKVDLASVSFLLPPGDIKVQDTGHDLHKVTVLERHQDWQLVEYHFGNSHDSISRYRAFKDRIEPVSYRNTMHMGLFVGAIILLVPVAIISFLINAIWKAVARRRKASDVA